MKLPTEPMPGRKMRARPVGMRRRRRGRRRGIVFVLVVINIGVFFVQHLTASGYQRLVPEGAREVAVRAASELREVDALSLALALEQRLHVPGKVDEIRSELEAQLVEGESTLGDLRRRRTSGAAAFGLADQIRAADVKVRTLRRVVGQVDSLAVLLGEDHEAGGVSLQELREGHVWTLFTHMFVHGGIMHLALNMIVLAAAGSFVVMCLGARHFALMFFAGGLIGAALQVSFFSNVYLIGASAGVYATTIAALLLLPEDTFYRFRIRLRPHLIAIGITIVTSVMLIWTLANPPDATSEQTVAHLAHLGGIMTGWYYVRMLGVSPHGPVPDAAFRITPQSGGR